MTSSESGGFYSLEYELFLRSGKMFAEKRQKLLTSKIFLLKSLLSRKNSDEGFKGKLCTEDTKYGASS